jgi:TonB family protein
MKRPLAIASLLIAIAAPLHGKPSPLGTERPDVVARWQGQLGEVDEALRAGDWKAAMTVLHTLIGEMTNRVEGGEGARSLFAAAAMYRGVAQVGLGDLEGGQWDHGIALAMYPDLVEADLSVYGEPGKYLVTPRSTEVKNDPPLDPSAVFTPPKKIRGLDPQYPYAKRNACVEAPVLVEFILDEQGGLRSPSIPQPTDPVLTFIFLDTARTWRFRPATSGGRPVAIRFKVKVNFGLDVCRNPLAVSRPNPTTG